MYLYVSVFVCVKVSNSVNVSMKSYYISNSCKMLYSNSMDILNLIKKWRGGGKVTQSHFASSRAMLSKSTLFGESWYENVQYQHWELESLRNNAQRLYKNNPHAHSIIENLVAFVIGNGARLVITSDNEGMQDRVYEWWNRYSESINWVNIQKEIVRRCLRDGETFLFYPEDYPDFVNPLVFIEPELIDSQDEQFRYGIGISDRYAGLVLGYRIRIKGTGEEIHIPAHMMQHIKINVDSNVKRGETTLLPVMKDLESLATFREHRVTQNIFRSAVILLQKLVGGEKSIKEQLVKEKEDSGKRLKAWNAGTIITVDAESDVQFINPNLGSDQAEIDYRMLILAIAAGLGLPEFVFSADAKNNNLASIKQATLTLIKQIEHYQSIFNNEFVAIFRRMINSPDPLRTLQPLMTTDQAMRVHFNFPVFDIRDQKTEVEVLLQLSEAGIVAKQEIAGRLGFDYNEQVKMIAKEVRTTDVVEEGNAQDKN